MGNNKAVLAFFGFAVVLVASLTTVSLHLSMIIASSTLLLLSLLFVAHYSREGVFCWITWFMLNELPFTILPFWYLAFTQDFEFTYMDTSRIFSSEDEIVLYTLSAAFLYGIGLVGVFLGFNSQLARGIGNRLPVYPLVWDQKRFRLALLFLSAVGMGCYLKYMQEVGGITHMISNLEGRWELEFSANKYYRWGAMLWGTGFYAFFINHLCFRKNHWVWVYLLVYFFFLFSLGLRGSIFGSLVTLFLFYTYLGKRKIRMKAILAAFFIFFVISFVITCLRMSDEGVGLEYLIMVKGNYGAVNQLALVMKAVPEKMPILLGESFWNALVMFIPRSLWEEKPVGLGHYIAKSIWEDARGGPAPYSITEFFLNFHLPGIILGMIFVGFIGRILYQYLASNHRNPSAVLIYATLFSIGSGSLSGTFVDFSQRLIPVLLALLFIGGGKLLRPRAHPVPEGVMVRG